jgi:hypothetical protein
VLAIDPPFEPQPASASAEPSPTVHISALDVAFRIDLLIVKKTPRAFSKSIPLARVSGESECHRRQLLCHLMKQHTTICADWFQFS